jgi:hypothetical protein
MNTMGRFSRPRQGQRSFSDFVQFHREWLRPHLLGDLHTIFRGSKQYWQRKRRRLKVWDKPGRGDFFLAECLFSAFDHVGGYLANGPSDSFEYHVNIARTAACLRSTKDIPNIICDLGRNPLVHYNWTQTAKPMEDRTWAFGLDICASADKRLHDILSMQWYPLDPLRATERREDRRRPKSCRCSS